MELRLSVFPAHRVFDLFHIASERPADREKTRVAATSGATLSVNYFVMNAAATLIAGYGLLANSEAVIIGAMLIAMLFGPILAIGLALAELDVRLLAKAVIPLLDSRLPPQRDLLRIVGEGLLGVTSSCSHHSTSDR